MCLGGEAGWDGESGRYQKKILDIIEVFFFLLKVSKYFTFPLPLNNVSCKWSSTGCVALGPEVCALLPWRQSLKAEVPEASFSSSSFKPQVSCKKPNKGEKQIQGFIVVGKEHMRLKKVTCPFQKGTAGVAGFS